MAQLLKLLATKPEDLSSIPRDHMVKGMANLLQNYPLHTHLHQKKKKKVSFTLKVKGKVGLTQDSKNHINT